MMEHLKLRRGLGRNYVANEFTLTKFSKLAHRKWPNAKTVTRKMVMAYLRSNRHMKTVSRGNELTYIRMFCMDLAAQGEPVFIPERKLLPKSRSSVRVHIFSEPEVLRIMKVARSMRNSILASSYSTLVGLFWTTGLRVQEAIGINVGDINRTDRLLFVRGKYGKSRLVPLSKSTLQALDAHVGRLRRIGIAVGEKDPLFVGIKRTRMKKRTASGALRRFFCLAEVKTAWGGIPRTMDLRHSFATHALKGVREHGTNPGNQIPALAIAMGHITLGSTQTYLHPTMETLQVASKAFERKLLSLKGAA